MYSILVAYNPYSLYLITKILQNKEKTMKKEDNLIWYDLTAAQNVAILQCKYTLFKKVINNKPKEHSKLDFNNMSSSNRTMNKIGG